MDQLWLRTCTFNVRKPGTQDLGGGQRRPRGGNRRAWSLKTTKTPNESWLKLAGAHKVTSPVGAPWAPLVLSPALSQAPWGPPSFVAGPLEWVRGAAWRGAVAVAASASSGGEAAAPLSDMHMCYETLDLKVLAFKCPQTGFLLGVAQHVFTGEAPPPSRDLAKGLTRLRTGSSRGSPLRHCLSVSTRLSPRMFFDSPRLPTSSCTSTARRRCWRLRHG